MSDLILVQATSQPLLDECRAQNSQEWAAPIFTTPQYIAREQSLSKSAFSQKRKTWMLVSFANPGVVLCSCETYERPATIIEMNGEIVEGVCMSIASVFTLAQNRGNGYARRMIVLLGERMPSIATNVLCSNLFSDIGPLFYASMGWKVFSNEQGEIKASQENVDALYAPSEVSAQLVNEAMLEELISHDNKLTLKEMAFVSANQKQSVVSVHPTVDNIKWIHARAALYASHSGNACPTNWGARVDNQFMLWTHDFKENVLLITRVRAEDKSVQRQLLSMAIQEAITYKFTKVVIWNPEFAVKGMQICKREGSIPSMRFFGKHAEVDTIWHANEKFGWV